MGLSNHGGENAPCSGSSKEEDLTRKNSAGEEKEPQTEVEDVLLFSLNPSNRRPRGHPQKGPI